MSFLKTETTMTVWQVAFFKIPMVTAGILLGTYFHNLCQPLLIWLWIVCVATTILIVPMGMRTVLEHWRSTHTPLFIGIPRLVHCTDQDV